MRLFTRLFGFVFLGSLSCAVLVAAVSGDETPSAAEQDRILQLMHQYADEYVAKLPNFLCVQTTRQLEAGLHAKKWKQGDTLVYSLSFNEGKERRGLQLVNGKPAAQARRAWRVTLTSEGEFGILLSQVLGKDSEANYRWDRWESIGGKRMAVFDFAVDREHSTLSLGLSDLAKAVLPYSGTIFGDPETGVVWRIADSVTEIPEILGAREMETTVDYAPVQIGDKLYLLPAQATVSVLLDSQRIRNEIAFSDYRKFEVNTSIQFEAK